MLYVEFGAPKGKENGKLCCKEIKVKMKRKCRQKEKRLKARRNKKESSSLSNVWTSIYW